VFNQQLTKNEYEDFLAKAELSKFSSVENWRIKFEEFLKTQASPPDHNTGCENVVGDYLTNCKNCTDCFCLTDSIDCNSCFRFWGLKSSVLTATGGTELGLENITGIGQYIVSANYTIHECSYLAYCKDLLFSKNCLGCVGLKHKQYAILNKEYSSEEYSRLAKKVLELMSERGELGEFFPISFSPFPYNDSLASDIFPLSKQQCLQQGLNWRDDGLAATPNLESPEIPDALQDFNNLNASCHCLRKMRPYKIIPQELEFYRKLNIPIPRLAPLTRMDDLLRFQPVYRLEDKKCARISFDGRSCDQSFKSAFVPGLINQKTVCRGCYEELN